MKTPLTCLCLLLSLPTLSHEYVEFQPPFSLNPPKGDFPQGPGSYYSFTGEIWITGEYAISWRQYGGKYNLYGEIIPDAEDAQKLPVHKDNYVDKLVVGNTESFVELVLTSDERKSLDSDFGYLVKGENTFKINNYWLGADCDQKWYMADVLEVKTTEFANQFSMRPLWEYC